MVVVVVVEVEVVVVVFLLSLVVGHQWQDEEASNMRHRKQLRGLLKWQRQSPDITPCELRQCGV